MTDIGGPVVVSMTSNASATTFVGDTVAFTVTVVQQQGNRRGAPASGAVDLFIGNALVGSTSLSGGSASFR